MQLKSGQKGVCPTKGAYVRWFVPSGPNAVLYVQILTRGYSKNSVYPVLWRTSVVRFAKRMSDGPPLYVRTTDSSVRPPKSSNCPSSVLSDPKPKLILLTKLLTPS